MAFAKKYEAAMENFVQKYEPTMSKVYDFFENFEENCEHIAKTWLTKQAYNIYNSMMRVGPAVRNSKVGCFCAKMVNRIKNP